MAEAFELESVKRQLTKEILQDLGIEDAVAKKYSNKPAEASALIDEYGKYYRQLYKYINTPFEVK